MLGNLQGKVAIITGSANGIGKAIAEKFAKHGAKVVIADLDLTSAQTVAEEIKADYNQDTLGIKVDVSKEDQVKQAVADTIKKFGKIDILVSNAGNQIISPIVDFELDRWERVMNIHVSGTFLFTKACMKEMIKQKTGGRIIIIGSIHSFEPAKNKSAYIAAKHALLGFVKAIAQEGAEHNISSNLIGPGYVRTQLVEKQIPEQARVLGITEEEVINSILLAKTVDQKFTLTDDIANIATFLGGFETNALTGQSILATHGWHM